MPNMLRIFISSVASMSEYRQVCEDTLRNLCVYGNRFEAWPPSPNGSLEECFAQIDESDGLLLLLGDHYGTIVEGDISATHAEYRHALATKKPIFAYRCDSDHVEERQAEFILEVEGAYFRGKRIVDIEALRVGVRNSFAQEFARCFRKIHAYPPAATNEQSNEGSPPSPPECVEKDALTADDAIEMFERLHNAGKEIEILESVPRLPKDVRDDVRVRNLIAVASVNSAGAGHPVPKVFIVDAIDLWRSDIDSGERPKAEHYYNLGNAYAALGRVAPAISSYLEALKLKCDYGECWKNLGNCYIKTRDASEAMRCFKNALEADPALYEALYSLGTMAISEDGDANSAQDYLDRIWLTSLTVDRVAGVLAWKAHAARMLGKTEQGIAWAEQSIRLAPELDWTWSAAVRHYVEAKYLGLGWQLRASFFWHRYIERYPESTDAHVELGIVYHMLGHSAQYESLNEEATKLLERAVALGHEDPSWIRQLIEELHARGGRPTTATDTSHHGSNL